MDGSNPAKRQYDIPWKTLLKRYFPLFLAFYFEEIYNDVDWSIAPVHLDTELPPEQPNAKVGRRHVDHLVRVTLKNGQARVILIHTEIQCQRDDTVADRLLNYIVRIKSIHGVLPVTLLILGDDDPDWRVPPISVRHWNYRFLIQIPTVKLLDHEGHEQTLLESDNPFSMITLAHLYAIQAGSGETTRIRVKKHLIHLLLQKQYPADVMAHLINFLDYTIPLDNIVNSALWTEAKKEYPKMEYLAPIFQDLVDQSEVRGEVRGEARGEARGLIKGKADILLRLLEKKFGPLSAAAFDRVGEASAEQLDRWSLNLLDAETLDQVWG